MDLLYFLIMIFCSLLCKVSRFSSVKHRCSPYYIVVSMGVLEVGSAVC